MTTEERNRIVVKHLAIAERTARSLMRRWPQFTKDELHSFAYRGLIDAVSSFDESRGRMHAEWYYSIKTRLSTIDQLRHAYGRKGMLPTSRRVKDAVFFSDVPNEEDRAYSPVAKPEPPAAIERLEWFNIVFAGLPPRSASILRMYVIECMTWKQIAERFDLSEGAVYYIVRASKKHIRERFPDRRVLEELTA